MTLPARHSPAVQQLDAMKGLGEDWDSYGAAAPTAVALKRARRLIQDAERTAGAKHAAASPYDVSPLPDGGVAIEWRGRGVTLQLGVGPRGQYGYLMIVDGPEGRRFTEDEDIPPSKVVELVERVLRA